VAAQSKPHPIPEVRFLDYHPALSPRSPLLLTFTLSRSSHTVPSSAHPEPPSVPSPDPKTGPQGGVKVPQSQLPQAHRGGGSEEAVNSAQPSKNSGVSKDMATTAINRPAWQPAQQAEAISAAAQAFVSDYSKMEDAAVMLRVRDGDMTGYEYLLTKYRKPMINFMYRMVRNQAIAEELAQEVFLRIYRSRATYRAEARFTTWLYRIATNLGVNYSRDSKHELAASNVYLDAPDPETGTRPDLADLTPNIEQDILRDERLQAIREQVQALPERQRIAVIMHKYQGLDYREIGTVLKLSESATKSLLFRAYQSLRERLQEFMGGI
jgi:RNA polymerase sigma-70 factor, ECF subfamily